MTDPAPIEDVRGLIEAANEQLVKEGGSRAEQSFGLGCTLLAFPVLIVIVVLFVSGRFNLIMALLALFMSLLLIVGISGLLAIGARKRALRNTFEQTVEPDLARFMSKNHFSRRALERHAFQILPSDAPLLAFFTPPPEAEQTPET